MIQRIQSVFLLLAFHLSAILVFFIDLLKVKGAEVTIYQLFQSNDIVQILIGAGYVVSGVLALLSMMLFKKRSTQLKINKINILLNFLLFGLLLFYLFYLSGESLDSLKGIGVWVPLGSIVLLFLANRAVQKDDDLVKSVDRIR